MDKILVVEKDPAFREVICASLSNAGYVVTKTGSGRKGIQKIQSSLFDVVVIDSIDVPNKKFVKRLQRAGVKVLAYVNVGQAEEARDYWDDLDKSMIFKEDPNWPKNYFVDVNSPKWHDAILNDEIPDVLKMGNFDGLVLDMLDVVDIYQKNFLD